jgi:hypothetical protein
MGKWLNQLRENTNKPRDITDKTAPETVLSVLSVRSGGVFKNLTPESAGSVSFVGSQYEPFQNSGAFNNRHGGDEEDWQSALDKRAAILEFDHGVSREEPSCWPGVNSKPNEKGACNESRGLVEPGDQVRR